MCVKLVTMCPTLSFEVRIHLPAQHGGFINYVCQLFKLITFTLVLSIYACKSVHYSKATIL